MTFTPNDTADAANTAVQFHGMAGFYHFEVTMSDSRGLTEAIETVAVELAGVDGITPPSLVSIVDNVSGGPILVSTGLIYTVTFDKAMDAATIGAADFGNGGSAAITIDSVTPTGDPAVFEVAVSAIGPGALTLEILAGATITDLSGNPLDTTTALPDDTTIMVNAGEIVIDGTAFWKSQSATITGTFDASGSDKLVVILTGEHGHNNNAGTVTSVTYDNVPLTPVIQRNAQVASTDTVYNHIWILDNPAESHVAGEIVANVVNRGNVTVFGLSGTLAGAGATAISATGTRSVDLATTASNSLVIASFGMGGAGNTANVGAVTVDDPLKFVSAQNNGGGSIWDGHVTAYAKVPAAGNGTYSFSGGNEAGAYVIAAEFLMAEIAVPDSYETWTATNAPIGNPDDDFDFDGVPNAIEFILGGDKDTNDRHKLPTATMDSDHMIFSFVRDKAALDASLGIAIETGTDLVTWPEVFTVGADTANSTAGVTVEDNLDGTDTVTLTVPLDQEARKFVRLKVAIAP